MDASYKIQRGIHVHLIQFFMCPEFWVHIIGVLRFFIVNWKAEPIALAIGVDAKTLSGILGHTKASFTLDTYTHVTGDMQKRASEIVGGFMENIMVR